MSERKAPISVGGFQKMVERLSVRAKLGFQVHAHMLRHACGFKMANDGVDTRTIQAYLGHKDKPPTGQRARDRRVWSRLKPAYRHPVSSVPGADDRISRTAGKA